MNIAIDVRSLMEGKHSGVEEYTIQIIRAFIRVAPHHTYHLFYNSGRRIKLPKFEGRIRIHGFRYPNKMFNAAQFSLAMPRWDNLVKADCFFVPNVRLMPLDSMTPLVVTAHDLSFERFPEFYSWRRRLWHKLVRTRLLMQNADNVVAVSAATAADVTSLYDVSPDKVSVIHSGVNSDMESDSSSRARAKAKYHLPDRFVLYLGTLEPRKNIASVIDAYSAIADQVPHDLVIAGAEGWLLKEMNEALLRSAARKRIHMIGFVDEVDKASLYGLADLFVYPSFYEGFGFPPLEALLAGTPVITSFNSALPEVVGKWALLIDPYDVSELALVMQESLLDLPEVNEEVKNEIREKYSWDQTAKRTLEVIEKAI